MVIREERIREIEDSPSRRKEREQCWKKMFKEITPKNFPDLTKDISV